MVNGGAAALGTALLIRRRRLAHFDRNLGHTDPLGLGPRSKLYVDLTKPDAIDR